MDEKTQYLEKIESLIYSADKFNEMSFRLVLEGLVNKGGEEAEFLVVRFLTSRDLDINIRINIIRVVGYLQSPHFLIPLKKIIDTENNIHLKKEAVLSVAKYNDRRALNILNHALGKIKNTLLLETINREVSKIKKNNPIFALLPRFLESENDPKNMHITVGILKRILKPSDATTFTNYLNCGKPTIENAAFDILCTTGNLNHRDPIMKFFQDRFNQTSCIKEAQCEEFYMLTLSVKTYFLNFTDLIEYELENLGTQLFYIKDKRIRDLYISILCKSPKSAVISFVGQRFDADADLREAIIKEYSGNDSAVDLLFQKYNSGGENLKGLLIKSLLNSQKGIDHFHKNFDSMERVEQEIIVSYLPYDSDRNIGVFIQDILKSNQIEIKQALLKKIKESHNLSDSIREILFDPQRREEFLLMEKEYLDTITSLFPLTAVKQLLGQVASGDMPPAKTKNIMEKIEHVASAGMAFKMKDETFIGSIFSKILETGNSELNLLLLKIFKNIKTFDLSTYNHLNRYLGVFLEQRGKNISKDENEEARKIRSNLKDLYDEIKKIVVSIKTMDRLFAVGTELDFDRIAEYLSKNSLCVALNIDRLRHHITKRFEDVKPEVMGRWIDLFYNFPMIGWRLRDIIYRKVETSDGRVKENLSRLYQSTPEQPIKIVIRLESQHISTVLKEQCLELIPGFPIDTTGVDFAEDDVLICDTDALKDFILKNTLPSQKLFLFLEKRSDFPEFKSYNPRPFLKPFSAFRIMREILKELYV